MTVITQEQDIAFGEERLSSLYAAVLMLRREIEALGTRVRGGEMINETTDCRPVREVHGLVAQCTKAELSLDESRKKQAGIAQGGYALDLDKARADIGCKLDRLRRCSDPN